MNEYMEKEKEKKEQVGSSDMQNDEFVKNVLSRKETALSFFQNYLPAEITKHINVESLKISKDSFVDKKMSEYFSDLLYEVQFKDAPAFLYFLFEHKSDPATLVSFQMLKYMVHIWELFLKQNEKAKKLPVILPILLYHGERGWNIGKDFFSLFEIPTELLPHVMEYIPDFNYRLYDISHMPDEEIVGDPFLRIFLFTLKYIFKPELLGKLSEIMQMCNEIEDKTKRTEYVEILLRYIFRKLPDIWTKKIEETVIKIINGGGDIMPTIAESWEAKGEERGKEKTTWEFIKNAFNMNLPMKAIEQLTGLTAEQINSMKEKMAHSS